MRAVLEDGVQQATITRAQHAQALELTLQRFFRQRGDRCRWSIGRLQHAFFR